MSSHNIHVHNEIRNLRKTFQIFVFLSYRNSFLGTQKVISNGKRGICVGVIRVLLYSISLCKHAYSNIQKISSPKLEKKKSDKISDIFHISAQNILWVLVRTATIHVLSRNKKHNVYPCKPKFY